MIAGAGVGGGFTWTSGGGTKDGGGGANFGGGGRFSGGGGGGGLTSSMILVSIGARITSTMRWARPVTRAQPSSTCIAITMPMPTACLPGWRCCWAKSTMRRSSGYAGAVCAARILIVRGGCLVSARGLVT